MKRMIPFLLCGLLLLSGCGGETAKSIIEINLAGGNGQSDPIVKEELIYVSDSIDRLELNVSFQMEGERGVLEIADHETGQILWSGSWEGTVDQTAFPISLHTVEKEKEYVIRFTGTKIQSAKIVITSDDKLAKDREAPTKPDKP